MLSTDPMRIYRAKRNDARRTVNSKYLIIGFISSGTYGRVYKAQARTHDPALGESESTPLGVYAIKKFKPDKEGEVVTYTGISQSAIREIALNRELDHENVVKLREVILEDKSIYMVFEYAEHDFLQIIHHFSTTLRQGVPVSLLKSLIHQLLNGLIYLHTCHILHRDLKPANILITDTGLVKIGDLGLARLTYAPLQPLYTGDKVVVTIWYRAPELLLGARHYNKAVDVWAVGCVMAELVSLRPIFKGEEAKLDQKKNVPFQRDQMIKIMEVMGKPQESDWPSITHFPEYTSLKSLDFYPYKLNDWCASRLRIKEAKDLLSRFFTYNPETRITASEAFHHAWFQEDPKPTLNAFHGIQPIQVPPVRRITQEEGLVAHQGNLVLSGSAIPIPGPGSGQNFGSAYTQAAGGVVNRGTGGAGADEGRRKKARLQ